MPPPTSRPLDEDAGRAAGNVQQDEGGSDRCLRCRVRQDLNGEGLVPSSLIQKVLHLVGHHLGRANPSAQAGLMENHPDAGWVWLLQHFPASESARRFRIDVPHRDVGATAAQRETRVRLGLEQAHDEDGGEVADGGRFALRIDVRSEPRRVLPFDHAPQLSDEQIPRAECAVARLGELQGRHELARLHAAHIALGVAGGGGECRLGDTAGSSDAADVLTKTRRNTHPRWPLACPTHADLPLRSPVQVRCRATS